MARATTTASAAVLCAGVVAALAGCGSGATTPAAPTAVPAGACTGFDTTERVSLDLGPVLPEGTGPLGLTGVVVRLVLPDLGVSQERGVSSAHGQAATVTAEADLGDEPVRVDVEVAGLAGAEPFRASTTATPSLHQPNGASCDGPTYSLDLLAAPDGSLTAFPRGENPRRSADGTQPYLLPTHCGIEHLRLDGSGYARVGGSLDDGSSNPPDGWDNPVQEGRLRLDGDLATFTDDTGHEEVFQLAAPDAPPPPLCA